MGWPVRETMRQSREEGEGGDLGEMGWAMRPVPVPLLLY